MKTFNGTVVSTKMSKSIVVEVERSRPHPLYRKIMRRRKRYKVHCEEANIKVGDVVKIVETRPISKEKHFAILKILK